MKKSTHRGFRGPNNFLLARPMFSSRNRTSFFRRRIDRCRCLDRSRCSKTIENGRKIIAFAIVCFIKSTHRSLCSPNNVLLERPIFLTKSKVVFRRRFKRSKTLEKILVFAIRLPNEIANVVFSTPIRPMPMPRSIAVLENDRKRSKKS